MRRVQYGCIVMGVVIGNVIAVEIAVGVIVAGRGIIVGSDGVGNEGIGTLECRNERCMVRNRIHSLLSLVTWRRRRGRGMALF